jgi:hypothetical protein
VVFGVGGSPGLSSSGGAASALGWKRFIEAQALTNVPSTEEMFVRQQPVAVLGEDRGYPDRQTSETSGVIHLFHQLLLRADREQDFE